MKIKPLYSSSKETFLISLSFIFLFFIIYLFYKMNKAHHTINLVLGIIISIMEAILIILIFIFEIKYIKTRKVKKYGTPIKGKIIKLNDLSGKIRLSSYITYKFLYNDKEYIVENEKIAYSYYNTFKKDMDKGIDDIELIVYQANAIIKIKEY